MDGGKHKKKIESSQNHSKEIEAGYNYYIPSRKSILSKLKAKKRNSHKNIQKQKSNDEASKLRPRPKQKEDPQPPKEEKPITEPPSKHSIANFYRKERRKLNVWTFLFKKLYTSFNQILTMCEVERKLEFCEGIEDTLKNFLKETQKVTHSMRVEETEKNKKSKAWEIRAPPKKDPTGLSSLSRIDEKRVDHQFDDKGQVEFKLLNELVSDGKLSFYEAIVLIIRERAVLFDIWGEAESREFLLNGEGVEELSLSRGSFAYQSTVLSKGNF